MTGTRILIGGAPTTGKSTVANLLSKHLNLPWISTDQIRETMRVTADRKKIPNLFNPEGYDAERFLTEFSAEEIVRMEMEQGDAVWPGVKNFIEEDYTWKQGFIIEGVNILPHLVAQDLSQPCKAVFLIDEDADRTREVVFTRGLWGDAHTYSDDVKEKEVEWAVLFSHKLNAEAERYGFPCIEVQKRDTDLDLILAALKL